MKEKLIDFEDSLITQLLERVGQLEKTLERVVNEVTKPSSEKGMAAGYQRKSYVVSIENVERVRMASFFLKKNLKNVIEEALTDYFEKYNVPEWHRAQDNNADCGNEAV